VSVSFVDLAMFGLAVVRFLYKSDSVEFATVGQLAASRVCVRFRLLPHHRLMVALVDEIGPLESHTESLESREEIVSLLKKARWKERVAANGRTGRHSLLPSDLVNGLKPKERIRCLWAAYKLLPRVPFVRFITFCNWWRCFALYHRDQHHLGPSLLCSKNSFFAFAAASPESV
jgi:hypothetical protein